MHLKWMKNGDSLGRWWFLAWDLSHGHSGNKNHWIFTTVGPSHRELVILEIEELRSLETVRSFWLVKAKRCHPLWAGCRGYVQPIRWAEKMQLLPEMLQEAEDLASPPSLGASNLSSVFLPQRLSPRGNWLTQEPVQSSDKQSRAEEHGE